MTDGLVRQAGSAVRWRATQLAGVQGIYFLRLLVLAALLAPDAFGLLAIASIALSTLMRVSDVGMIPALVQHAGATRDQHDAAWTVGLVRALLVTAALVVAAPLIATMFDEPRATGVIQALALRPSIEALASIGIARLTRNLRFRELAFIYVPAAVVDLFVAVLTVPALGVWALVAGSLAGSATMAALSYVFAPQRPRIRWNWADIAPLVDFGMWVLASGVVVLAGTLLTQLAVSRLLDATALGIFFLATKLAYFMVDAANSVVGTVAFPMFARLRREGRNPGRLLTTLLTGMHLLLLPAYALVMALVPQFESVLGPQWAGTAPVVRILCFAALSGITGNVLSRYLMGQGDARGAFLIEVLNATVALLLVVPLILVLSTEGAALAWLGGSVATLVAAVVWIRRQTPGVIFASVPRIAAAAVVAIAAGAAAWAVAASWSGLSGLIAGGCAGVLAGGLLLWAQNLAFGLELQEFQSLVRKPSD